MLQQVFKYVPSFRGKNRCYRFLFGSQIRSKKDVSVKNSYGLEFRLPNIHESIGFEIYFNGVYEKETIDLIINRLPRGSAFLDIGANIGSILLPVAKKRPDVACYGIEASPRVFRYLTVNLESNRLANSRVFNYAATDCEGEEVKFFSPRELFGKGSMSAVFTDEFETVSTVRVDRLIEKEKIERIGLIKVDIEGYEYFALKGAEKLLQKQTAPDILFEFSAWSERKVQGLKAGDAQALLMGYGYTIYRVGKNNKLVPLRDFLTEGDEMILATKKPI